MYETYHIVVLLLMMEAKQQRERGYRFFPSNPTMKRISWINTVFTVYMCGECNQSDCFSKKLDVMLPIDSGGRGRGRERGD